MPRDNAPRADAIVPLPGNRRGRLVETIAAGTFRVEVVGHGWISRLAAASWLDRNQVEAAELLAALFHQAGLAPSVCGSYDGIYVEGASVDFGLERETRRMAAARRRLAGLLGAVASRDRSAVTNCVLWDLPPPSLPALQRGLGAVAQAIRRPRR